MHEAASSLKSSGVCGLGLGLCALCSLHVRPFHPVTWGSFSGLYCNIHRECFRRHILGDFLVLACFSAERWAEDVHTFSESPNILRLWSGIAGVLAVLIIRPWHGTTFGVNSALPSQAMPMVFGRLAELRKPVRTIFASMYATKGFQSTSNLVETKQPHVLPPWPSISTFGLHLGPAFGYCRESANMGA